MGKRSKTTELLLSVLEKAMDTGVFLYDFANNPHHYAYGTPNPDRYQLYHIVQRLKKKGWVESEKNEGKILIKLTTKGKNQLAVESALRQGKWDGLFRVVIFDIPEKHRRVRNVLRRRLKEWGFKPMQKSVWVTKKDITFHMREFVKDLGVEDWVLVIVSGDIGSARIFDDRQ